ncbi:hypothetical protein [Nocardia sp. NPDC051570]|uniref:hypothetical protein n=1 Tax=Nocardia sp. NPDC051570 TaxID=3364324 RepID=UPI00379BA0E2
MMPPSRMTPEQCDRLLYRAETALRAVDLGLTGDTGNAPLIGQQIATARSAVVIARALCAADRARAALAAPVDSELFGWPGCDPAEADVLTLLACYADDPMCGINGFDLDDPGEGGDDQARP